MSKPFTINYEISGKKRAYTPPFLVIEDGYKVITDCKLSVSLTSEKTLDWYEGVSEWCVENEYGFRVYTEKQIYSGYALENIRKLRRYTQHRIPVDFRASVFGVMGAVTGSISLQTLIDGLPEYPRQSAFEGIFHMAFHHEVELDIITAPISLASRVSLAGMASVNYQTGADVPSGTSTQTTAHTRSSAA